VYDRNEKHDTTAELPHAVHVGAGMPRQDQLQATAGSNHEEEQMGAGGLSSEEELDPASSGLPSEGEVLSTPGDVSEDTVEYPRYSSSSDLDSDGPQTEGAAVPGRETPQPVGTDDEEFWESSSSDSDSGIYAIYFFPQCSLTH